MAAQSTVTVAQEGLITERFTQAIEQLGNDKIAVRLGGIYALKRIAQDSEKDHRQITEVLTTLVRENSPMDEHDQSVKPITADIQAILTVLGQLNTKYGEIGKRLDLHNADLRGADLRDLNFRGAILIDAKLQRARLNCANLQDAHLSRSILRCADLTNANLQGAILSLADSRGADLTDANLEGANLTNANFQWGPLAYIGGTLDGASPDAPIGRTRLRNVILRDATLVSTQFQGADLTNADFQGTDLTGSYFQRAFVTDSSGRWVTLPDFNTILTGANFRGADIKKADLRDTVGLTQEQIDSANFDETTKLPDHLARSQKP